MTTTATPPTTRLEALRRRIVAKIDAGTLTHMDEDYQQWLFLLKRHHAERQEKAVPHDA